MAVCISNIMHYNEFDKDEISAGAIAGIVIGCFAVLLIIAIIAFIIIKKKSKHEKSSSSSAGKV